MIAMLKVLFIIILGRPTYEPEVSAADIRSIIKDEMRKQNVSAEDIRKETEVEVAFIGPDHHRGSKRYFEAEGFAWFNCFKVAKHNRVKRWASAHAWCFIDLKELQICYRYKQECNKCNLAADKGPEFTRYALNKMARYAVRGFLIRTGRIQVKRKSPVEDKDEESGDGPHDEERCEKCRRMGRPCWK